MCLVFCCFTFYKFLGESSQNSIESIFKMSINNTETRLLLSVWGLLDKGEKSLTKGKFFPSFSGKDKEIKQAEYKDALQALIDSEAIALSSTTQVKYSLADVGLQRLADGLRSPDFSFEGATLVSSRLANAALRWFQQNSGEVVAENVVTEAIAQA